MSRLFVSMTSIIRCSVFRTHGISQVRSSYRPWPLTFIARALSTDNQVVPEFKVYKFGELIVRSESVCSLTVGPVNPQLYPDQDQAFFEFQPEHNVSTGLKFVCTDLDKTSRLSITKNDSYLGNSKPGTCLAKVPIKYDIDVQVTNHRNLSVESMQNDFVRVVSDLGDCNLSNIQTRRVSAKTGGGNIVSEGLLQGDAVLETKLDGSVKVFKPLCRHLVIRTDRGDISIGSLYADRSSLTSNAGNIDIRNAHRTVEILIEDKGNVSINSLDGDLMAKVNEGNVSVYACRHGLVTINVEKGDITVKVPEELTACSLDVRGNTVAVDKKLNQSSLKRVENDEEAHVTGLLSRRGDEESPASCSIIAHSRCGRVDIVCQDFISSLNLNKYAAYSDDDDD